MRKFCRATLDTFKASGPGNRLELPIPGPVEVEVFKERANPELWRVRARRSQKEFPKVEGSWDTVQRIITEAFETVVSPWAWVDAKGGLVEPLGAETVNKHLLAPAANQQGVGEDHGRVLCGRIVHKHRCLDTRELASCADCLRKADHVDQRPYASEEQ